jgi:tetratricopeptide (TPR) repeat protein
MLENITGEEIKRKFNSNSKLRITTYAVGSVFVLIIGFFAYRQFIWSPANEKSKAAYFEGLNMAESDSTDLAIELLSSNVKKFNGKVGGEIAQFVLARQYMTIGEFKKALKELKGVSVEDTYVSVMALGLQGDCQSELKNYEKAGELYIEAAELDENDFTAPAYLFKAGLCAEKVKDFNAATDLYTQIKNNYSAYASQKVIDKYIARASNKIVK